MSLVSLTPLDIKTEPPPSSDLAAVEAFLDENPEFFKDYLIRKASRHMIDSWLVAHSLPPGQSGSSSPHSRYPQPHPAPLTSTSTTTPTTTHLSPYSRSLSTGSRSTGSGGATPVRKISAQEFEKGGLTKPWVTTVDGSPTFLTQNNNNSELTGQIRKKSRTDLQSLGK